MGNIRVECKGAANVRIQDLVPIQGKLKNLETEAYEKLKKSIVKYGFSFPFFVWKDSSVNYIEDGHHRQLVLFKMIEEGWTCPPLPVCYVFAKNKKEAMRKLLALNSRFARITKDGLYEFMHEADLNFEELDADFDLPEINMSQFGSEFFEDEIVEDEIPEKPKKPITKEGDLWQLGDHIILCGDATDLNAVGRLMEDPPFLMVTDPPYGVEYDPEWREKSLDSWKKPRSLGKVQNDDQVDWRDAYALFPGDVAYVWHAGKYAASVSDQLGGSGFEIRSQIIWKKQHFVISRGDYHWGHEPCWYAVRKGKKSAWGGARDQSTVWEIKNASALGGENQKDQTGHGTQKPVECMAKPIRNHGKPGDRVYDPFLGSGTTLMAAHQLNRICLGTEIDPGYCDVIIERWEKLTGEKAVRK